MIQRNSLEPTGSLRWMIFRTIALLTVIALALAACQPSPPRPPEGVPETGQPTPKAQETPTPAADSGLQVVDDGSPLPPNVVERQPQGAQELPPGDPILLTFDQAMDIDKTNLAWQVTDSDGAAVQGEISWPDPRTLRFSPSDPLAPGSLYLASLGDQASSAAGVTIAEPYSFQFLTMGPLQVSQVFPADGSKGVAGEAVITAIFNRPVVPLVIAEEQETLPQPLSFSPDVSGKGQWVNTSVYAFQPDQPLKGGVTFSVTVKSGLEDAAGETELAENYTWQFSTSEPAIKEFEVSNGAVNPPDGAENILLDAYFTIRFMQPMDPDSTEAALSITSQAGEEAALTTEWNEAFTHIVITPTQQLALGTGYTLKLDSQAQAAGGGSLSQGLDWDFTTVPPPAILSTNPANGSTQGSFTSELFIKFASPMRIDTVKSRIEISPKPEKEIEWWYNDWDWSMVAFMLNPSTSYTVRFLAGMEDIYGNTIDEAKTIRFTTAARTPYASLLMPYEAPMMRAEGPPEAQQFYATYSNVSQVQFELHDLDTRQFLRFLTGQDSSYQYNPPETSLVWQEEEASQGKLNERVIQSYQPLAEQGEPLPMGFYFLGMDSPEVKSEYRFDDQRLLIVANANLTFKTSSTQALIWATDLESGEPLEGVDVTVYDNQLKAIGNGTTDQDGLAMLDLPAPADPYASRFALADDGQTFAFASSQWGSGVSLWDYGIWIDSYAPADQPKAYVYTERPIYRPGQPVYFKGIVRLDNDLDYSLPDQNQVKVRISSYQEMVYEEDMPLSSFGSFEGQFTLDEDAALGYYTLEAFFPGREESIGSVTFSVAEYRRPEFQVQVSAEPKDVLSGERFTAKVQADYYSGGGVSGAAVAWTLASDPFNFSPPDEYSGYSFTDIEEDVYGPQENGEMESRVIAQGEGQTDGNGQFTVTLPADLSEAKTSRQLTFEATVTDLSKSIVSGRASIVAHLSGVYPGVRPKSYVGEAGEEQTFEMVALDWEGKPIPDQKLSVEIVERRWYSVQEQDASGRVTWKSTVEEIPVASIEEVITDEKGLASVNFVPPNGGIYRARVTALDAKGNPGRSSAYMWVASDEYIAWQQTNDRSFDLVADQKSYQPGDKAQILIASPFQGEVYALATVERGRIRSQEVILLTSNSTLYELPITADMAPNVFISVVIVKGVDETNPRPDFNQGVLEIQVDTSQQSLAVELSADPATASPGEQVLFTVRTRDAAGAPVSAEVSLGLSDLATLSLMPPNSPPILDYFYSERTLSVWTTVPMVLSLDDYNANIEEEIQEGGGGGSGGGKGEDELGVVAVRQDFPDTAFWEAQVVTNEDGEAAVSVTLPDNLTTWRMDARAATEDTRVGQTTLDLVSTRPLLVRPQTPRFFVVNDQATLGAAVHNNTDQALSVKVSLSAGGLTLQSKAEQEIEIPAKGQAYVTWEALVDADAQRVDLVFSAEGGDLQDASRPPMGTLDNQGIPVYRYEAREVVGTSGMMTESGTQIEAISLPQSLQASEGELTVKVSHSLTAGMTDSLTYLENFPYECVEQTISSFLPNVVTTNALKSSGQSDPQLEANLKEQVETALQSLYNGQNADGGWGWWSNNQSDPLTSAYVVLGLVEAKEAGYTVSEPVLQRGLNYLRTQVKSIVGLTDPELVNRQAFILYVLARAGKPDVSSSVQLYEQRQRMALYAMGFLAQTLYLIDESDTRLKTLLADFNSQAITSASGSHWEEQEIDRWNWNTNTRTTAIILSALSLIDSGNPLNANAVRWLMSNRTDGRWLGTQETAWTVMALTNWMTSSGELEADYEYAVALNGERLGGGTANAETLSQSLELKVDVQKMLQDEANRLAIAREGGTGNLYYTAHLNVALPVEETQALDQGLVVSRSYYRLDDLQTPVKDAVQGELLLVRVTVVAPHDLHYVVIDDPLPAGLEGVDQSLSTSPQSVEVPQAYSYEDTLWRGWGWWFFTHTQYRDEKVVLSTDFLPAGTYVYTYLVRASTVGVFRVIPTTAQEFYFPEVYGRSEGSLFTVKP